MFGSADTCGYEEEPPVTWVKIEPADGRFAGELGHRDFLGTVMSLGLKRGVIGDIVAGGSTGYVCCLESVADYICENLDLSLIHIWFFRNNVKFVFRVRRWGNEKQ